MYIHPAIAAAVDIDPAVTAHVALFHAVYQELRYGVLSGSIEHDAPTFPIELMKSYNRERLMRRELPDVEATGSFAEFYDYFHHDPVDVSAKLYEAWASVRGACLI